MIRKSATGPVELTKVLCAGRRPKAWGLRLRASAAAFALLCLFASLPFTLYAQATGQPVKVLQPATLGVEYGPITISPRGGIAPFTWSVDPADSLPPGLTLDKTTGVLSGRPQAAREAPYVFTVSVTDSSAPNRRTFRKTYALLVTDAISDLAENDPAAIRATPAVTDEPLDCTAVDIESNADTVSIAVRNHFTPAGIIDVSKKQDPIQKPDDLIGNTLGKCQPEKWETDDHVIIHLVKWPREEPSSRGTAAPKYEVEQEKWFLYKRLARANSSHSRWERQTVQDGARIYGHERVAVLLMHLDARETWDIKYDVAVKEKLPANVQNAIDLAGVIVNRSLTAGRAAELPNLWGGRLLNVKDLPADITVASNIAFVTSGQAGLSLAPDGTLVASAESDKQTQQPKQYTKVYDNEGRYWWDVSVGMPVKSFKEVKYDAENGQVTAREVTRQNAYGFLNLFFRKVDTKGHEYTYSEFYKTTHLVVGVPISGKPLDRPVVGLGMGFYKTSLKFNVFVGAVFNRVREPRTLGAGQTATPAELEGDLRARRVTKFIFGFNIPVQQFRQAIAPKK